MSLRAVPAGVAALLAVAFIQPAPLRAGAPVPSSPAAAEPPAENAPADPAAPDAAATEAEPGDADATLPIPPVPPRIAEGTQYEACLDMLVTDPSGADALAASMDAGRNGHGERVAGRSEAAAHCHALAQVELGNTEAGAALLDRLAAGSDAPSASRAVVFAQAGQAWTMAGQAEQAHLSASRALALSPDDPELLIGHAVTALARQLYAEAADDLTHALELDPKRVDALILRATAWRNSAKLDRAKTDIDAAAAMDPDNADLLLERGIIRQRTGDLAGARADWQRTAELAPDTPTGDLAQQNLALLDAGPRQ